MQSARHSFRPKGTVEFREVSIDKTVGWKKNIYSTTPEAAADGGAASTVSDLVNFSHALRTGQLLSAAMTAAMLTPKVIEDAEVVRGYIWKYGYGNLFILNPQEQVVRWGHTGEEDGVSCRFYHYPNLAKPEPKR